MKPVDDHHIPISYDGFKSQVILIGLAVVGICLLVTILFKTVVGFGSHFETVLLVLLWIILPMLWLVWSAVYYTKLHKTRYTLTDDSLVIQKSQLLGTVTKHYRYDSILKVEAFQSFLDKNTNHGQVRLSVPRLNNPVILNYVEDPASQAKHIKRHVGRYAAHSKALIH